MDYEKSDNYRIKFGFILQELTLSIDSMPLVLLIVKIYELIDLWLH